MKIPAFLCALFIPLCAFCAEPSLSSVTTRPSDNFFARGSEAGTTLTVTGATPGATLPVRLSVFDFTRTNAVAKLRGKIALDGEGKGAATFRLPTDRYGIFYVSADVGGLSLPKVGTGPRGFFTYGVLEDPAKMPDIDPWDAFLGWHGGSSPWLWFRGGFGSSNGGTYRPSTNRLTITTLHRSCGEHKMGKRFWSMTTNEEARAEYRDNLAKYVNAAIEAGPADSH